jgi:hypothetical protein
MLNVVSGTCHWHRDRDHVRPTLNIPGLLLWWGMSGPPWISSGLTHSSWLPSLHVGSCEKHIKSSMMLGNDRLVTWRYTAIMMPWANRTSPQSTLDIAFILHPPWTNGAPSAWPMFTVLINTQVLKVNNILQCDDKLSMMTDGLKVKTSTSMRTYQSNGCA